MTHLPCLVDFDFLALIGVWDAGTFVSQSEKRETFVKRLELPLNGRLFPNSETLNLPKL